VNRSVLYFAVFAQLWGAGSVHAESEEDTLLAQGSELRREGHDEQALAVFSRALAASGSPRARAQVALADQALGRWVDAERDLAVALATNDPWIEQHRRPLATALDRIRKHLATLEVSANVVSGELFVNGTSVGTLPLQAPVRVVAGTLAIEARAIGFETQLRTIDVPAESRAREVMTLVRSPAPPTSVASQDTVRLDPSRSTDSGADARTAAWISVAGAAALLAGGTAALLVQNYNAAVWNDDSRCLSSNQTREELCGNYHSAARTAEVLTYINFVGAGAAAAAATVLFVVSVKSRTSTISSAGCRLSGLRIACEASF
jgi:hypothetical protein